MNYKPVWCCFTSPADGTLWLGGENEIARVKNGNVTAIELPGSENGSHTFVRALAIGKDNTIYVGTHEQGGRFAG